MENVVKFWKECFFGIPPLNKHTVYTRSGRGATEIPTMEMPGVPSYDNSERQLLASLEQELGVL